MQGSLESNRPLRAIIVDDEWLVRADLQAMLAEYPELEVISEANNLEKAVEVINSLKPELVFLDVQLPGGSGFDLLDKVAVSFKLIFVTAYDEYALRAFEVNALDYLLKPIHPERLAKTMKRVLEQTNEIDISAKRASEKLKYDDRFLLKVGSGGFKLLKLNSIKCILGAGDYSEVLISDAKTERTLVVIPLKEWEERLPDKHFARIHRSTLINLEYLERLEKWFDYSYQVYLRDIKEPFLMSRRYAVKLKERSKLEI